MSLDANNAHELPSAANAQLEGGGVVDRKKSTMTIIGTGHSGAPRTSGAKKQSVLEVKKKSGAGQEKEKEKDAESGDIAALQAFFKQTLGNQDKSELKKPLRRPKLTQENTYRLESKRPFVQSRVETIINDTLDEILTGLRYCTKTATNTCAILAEAIRNRVLHLEYDRYKIVVHVILGSMGRQGFCTAFKNLGDATRDSYAVGSFTSHHIFAAASVHAIYYD